MLRKRQILAAAVSSLVFVFLPYLYQWSFGTSIARYDVYAVWTVGAVGLCFLPSFLSAHRGVALAGALLALYLLCSSVPYLPRDSTLSAIATFIACTGIYCLCRRFISTPSASIYVGLLSAFAVQLTLGWVQAFQNDGHAFEIRGWLYNSGYFANYLLSILPMLASWLIYSSENLGRRRQIWIMLALVTAAGSVLLLLTMARSAIAGYGVALVFLLLTRYKDLLAPARVRWLLLAVAIPCILLTGYWLWQIKAPSARGRFLIWKVTSTMIARHPLFGVGAGNFAGEYGGYQKEYFQTNGASLDEQMLSGNVLEAFDLPLQVLAEYGCIGLLCWMLLLVSLFRMRSGPPGRPGRSTGHPACLLGLLISSLGSNPFHCMPVLVIAVCHLAFCLPDPQSSPATPRPSRGARLSTVAIGAILLLFSGYTAVIEVKWSAAASRVSTEGFSTAAPSYQALYPFGKWNWRYLFNYGAEAALDGQTGLSIVLLERAKVYGSTADLYLFLGDDYLQAGNYEKAQMNYRSAMYMIPSRLLPRYKLVQLYDKWGKKYEAQHLIDESLQRPVKVPSLFTNQVLSEWRVRRSEQYPAAAPRYQIK